MTTDASHNYKVAPNLLNRRFNQNEPVKACVSDLTERESVERELALIKVATETGPARAEVLQIADIFRAQVVDVGSKTLVLQVAGDTEKIDALEKLLRQYGIKELVRTGKIALLRGAKTVTSSK